MLEQQNVIAICRPGTLALLRKICRNALFADSANGKTNLFESAYEHLNKYEKKEQEGPSGIFVGKTFRTSI